MKKLFVYTAIVLLAAFGLSACGENTVSLDQARAMAEQAKRDEAGKADGKLSAARTEISKIAIQAARQGGYSAQANCNVLPAELGRTQAVKDFPTFTPAFYKEACVREVGVMNAERKINNDRAVAAEKERQRKLALAKANAEAKRKLAAQKGKTPVKPAAHKRS